MIGTQINHRTSHDLCQQIEIQFSSSSKHHLYKLTPQIVFSSDDSSETDNSSLWDTLMDFRITLESRVSRNAQNQCEHLHWCRCHQILIIAGNLLCFVLPVTTLYRDYNELRVESFPGKLLLHKHLIAGGIVS